MHTLTLKRVLGFTIVILLLLALFIWGIGLETLKARQVDLLYLGQRHLMLVFTSMFFALLVGIPSGILLSRPAAKGFAEYVPVPPIRTMDVNHSSNYASRQYPPQPRGPLYRSGSPDRWTARCNL